MDEHEIGASDQRSGRFLDGGANTYEIGHPATPGRPGMPGNVAHAIGVRVERDHKRIGPSLGEPARTSGVTRAQVDDQAAIRTQQIVGSADVHLDELSTEYQLHIPILRRSEG